MRAMIVAARAMTYAEPGRFSKRFGAGSITANCAASCGPSRDASLPK